MENFLIEVTSKVAATLTSNWLTPILTAVIAIAARGWKRWSSRVAESAPVTASHTISASVKSFLLNMLDLFVCAVVSAIVLSRFVFAPSPVATKIDVLWALGLVAFSAVYIWAGGMRYEADRAQV
ncbi:hypothetical protein [Ralstonia mannitolilytica]|uniref:hypothetical protein n=1 Tax=Ralstonia mannitolilytica TaxID=105219 RepID=UPI000C7CA4CC|nr:hypothetical protein [Ralstonia mannitolilytica]PLT18710.1 hypothetical protein CXP34_01515 [Ralstonia mannitolilytica]